MIFYLLLIFVFIFVVIYILTLFTGGWFIPVSSNIAKEMIEMAKLKKGDLVCDLGSGDGRLVIESAKLGAKAIGLEINPFLYFWSILQIKRLGLGNLAKIKLSNFWKEDLSKANVVFIFLPFNAGKLEKKLQKELKKGTRVITYLVVFPNWKPNVVTKSGIYFYTFNRSQDNE